MVRTKDTASVKVVGAKAPRKVTPSAATSSVGSSSSGDSKKKCSGGNPYFPRETPAWQKPITQFFGTSDKPCTSTSASTCDKEQEMNNGSTTNENCTDKQGSDSCDTGIASSSSVGGV
uniref:PCNA-associated factor n=1 Tax=Graphocephala atropunctata TaxID=36148 RepID=A0A1B6KGJ9_9HEMI